MLPLLMAASCGVPADQRQAENAGAQTAAPAVTGLAPAPPSQVRNGNSAASTVSSGKQAPVSACLVQDGRPIAARPLRAIGTEPFWAADSWGRCVTYSTPENQAGTRIWTRMEGSAENGSWTGALGGQRFRMATRPQRGCSDGMSDKSYPIAVTLEVSGEIRRGCAGYRPPISAPAPATPSANRKE